ncbi:MAG: sensor domain-containing diguanylate cyclase [Candidatus Omnitrophica bacterium]|nr:sensor domain-containing diguanylate cyclase [Candidatus Omnitrophota bacterium]
MFHSLKRTALGILSIISFILSTILFYKIPYGHGAPAVFYADLVSSIIFSYNIAVFFAWVGFGMIFGIGMAALSIALVLLLNLRVGLPGHSALVLPFLLTAFFGFLYWRARNRLNDAYRLKMEKAGENINIISNGIEDSRKGIFSVEEKLKRYAVLKGVIDSFSSQLLFDDVTKLIMEKTNKTIGKPGRVLLFLVDTEKQELMLSASRGAERVTAKKGDLFDRWVLKNRKSLIVEDVVTDFRFSTDKQGDLKKIFRSLIATPLVSGDKVIGILRMDSARKVAYTQDDLRLLDIIADLGAISIENALLYARTQELAIIDSMTGLAVRRYFLERLHAEVKRTAMKKGKMSLVMLDIDHFKKYNDQFGHAAGDIILKHIAKTINSMIREGDIAARYGGEEIVIMLCGRSKNEAALEAEEIRKAVKESPIMLRRHSADVTVSMGVSGYPEDASSAEALIRLADERLYKAKAQGRDRVCSA